MPKNAEIRLSARSAGGSTACRRRSFLSEAKITGPDLFAAKISLLLKADSYLYGRGTAEPPLEPPEL